MKNAVCLLFFSIASLGAMDSHEENEIKKQRLFDCATPVAYATWISYCMCHKSTNNTELLSSVLLMQAVENQTNNPSENDPIKTVSNLFVRIGITTLLGGKLTDNNSLINAGTKLILVGPLPLLIKKASESFIELVYSSYN